MSSNAYAGPLGLEWRESPWLGRYTDLVHLLALGALLLPIAWPWSGVLAVAVVIGLSWISQRHWLAKRRRRHMAGTWVWRADGVWVHEHKGHLTYLHMQSPVVALPWLISLRLRDEAGRGRRLLWFVDSVPADSWRQLQVRLREWSRKQHPDQLGV